MYIYITTNKYNNVLYIGVTNDLLRRMYEHKSGLIEGFSRKYKATKLVYYKEIQDEEAAILYEKRLKKYGRNDKFKLIKQDNPEMKDLSEDWDFGELGVPLEYTHFTAKK
ncbi:MAG: GIY-YIG nuclease family protein [Abditibacteriota bacterium]|nr:GIY-YIG nuclease family protein [Abditibacteriota bacterium]